MTITNVTPFDRGLTKGAYLVHDEPRASWEAGGQANEGTEQIAEAGGASLAIEQLGATGIDASPARGGLGDVRGAAPGQYLSTAQMFSLTNDAFVGLESLALIETDGTAVSSTVLLEGWDSGTESNTFAETSYEGAATDEPIQLHPEFPGSRLSRSRRMPRSRSRPGTHSRRGPDPRRTGRTCLTGSRARQLSGSGTGKAGMGSRRCCRRRGAERSSCG